MDNEVRLRSADPNPIELFHAGEHAVYWLGIAEETAFRCNTYLIVDGDVALLVDPGSRHHFDVVRDRVAEVLDPRAVTGMVLCHQDPDVAASMVEWLDLAPDMEVISSARAHVLLPHYGKLDYRPVDVVEQPTLPLPSGHELRFVEAPFLHFPGAFVTYDTAAKYLFSGDIWAALDFDWQLLVESFEDHAAAMDLFHLDYMASNIAARGFVRRVEGLDIEAICPQHGSIIGRRHVPEALAYLRNLRCGTDIVYADLG